MMITKKKLFSIFCLVISHQGFAQEKWRGTMLDAARLVEKPEYYRRFIDFSADWGYNKLIFRITDDQGSAVKFLTHPELITHPNALSRDDVKELVEYARQKGIEIIPEIQSFGHANYIVGTSQYSKFGDLSRKDNKRRTTTLIPLQEGSLALLEDLYSEAAKMFDAPYIHVGCDEVDWGGSPQSVELLANASRAEITARHINRIQEAVTRATGKQTLVWGDEVLRHEPKTIETLSRGVIIVDWNYETTTPEPLQEIISRAVDNGFRIIGAPALCWCRWGPRIGSSQLSNLAAYATAYGSQSENPNVLGVVVTQWVPYRYLPNSVWDGFAIGSTLLSSNGTEGTEAALQHFVSRHYGAEWNETWASLFNKAYQVAPFRNGCSSSQQQPREPNVWSTDAELRSVLDGPPAAEPDWGDLFILLDQVRPSINANHDDFESFVLSFKYLRHIYWRNAVARVTTDSSVSASDAMAILNGLASAEEDLAIQLRQEWQKGRDPGLLDAAVLRGVATPDSTVIRLLLGAKYTRKLTNDSDSSLRLLNKN